MRIIACLSELYRMIVGEKGILTFLSSVQLVFFYVKLHFSFFNSMEIYCGKAKQNKSVFFFGEALSGF